MTCKGHTVFLRVKGRGYEAATWPGRESSPTAFGIPLSFSAGLTQTAVFSTQRSPREVPGSTRKLLDLRNEYLTVRKCCMDVPLQAGWGRPAWRGRPKRRRAGNCPVPPHCPGLWAGPSEAGAQAQSECLAKERGESLDRRRHTTTQPAPLGREHYRHRWAATGLHGQDSHACLALSPEVDFCAKA